MPIEAGKIRNVAVVGHRGTGKTSLVEAMLFQAGSTNRLGSIEAGQRPSRTGKRTSSAAQMSISASLCHCEWQDRKLNLIDTPGDSGLPGGHGRLAARRRRRARRHLRRDGRGGEHVARLGPRGGARALACRLRQHARPRACRLLPGPRLAAGAAVGALRGDPAADRLRARAHGCRRPAAQLRVHGSVGRARGRSGRDPRVDWPRPSRSTGRSCSTRSSRPTRR